MQTAGFQLVTEKLSACLCLSVVFTRTDWELICIALDQLCTEMDAVKLDQLSPTVCNRSVMQRPMAVSA